VWLDLVPNHTSDRHPWFTDLPEYYVWSDHIPNDWTSVFTGGSAWAYHTERRRWYMHQFATQQPDLDWWNPDVRTEFEHILRHWFDRGVRGLRVDVAHALIKDRGLRNGVEHMRERPEVHEIYARWQEIAAEYEPKPTLMGETYVMPLQKLYPYWQHLDLAQNFNFVRVDFELEQLRAVVEETMGHLPPNREAVWFASNHDHSRMATRWAGGDERRHRAALFLLLTLPGAAILYQGDEIGLADGHVPPSRVLDIGDPPRDPERTPMPWTRSGDEWTNPWQPLTDTSRNVEAASDMLSYTRDLIRARRALGDGYETLDAPAGVWAYARGGDVCVLNMTARRRTFDGTKLGPWEGTIL
jgi:alpha-glucosidase